ncbi:MAG: 23S rRNA pseudouridine(955/2504/2580) synthase RluC [Oxalobacter sp.]|nr:23S rRNA pseudouridine(955/2504/2580) synthase RluC [Oxalobacter sp.]
MSQTNRGRVGQSAKKQQETPVGSNPAQVRLVTITENEDGQRIDNYLFKHCKGVPKSHVYRILRSGEVRVNKGRIDQTYRLKAGDIIRIPPVRMAEREEKAIPPARFETLFEDEHLLIINKPAGVAVHGGSGVDFGVIEQLRASRPELKYLELVHRLDRETSGILMLAKKRPALRRMHEQMREGSIDKRYQTLVQGNWANQRQHVKLPLFKYLTPDGERRVRVQPGGIESHTIFNVMEKYDDFTLLEAELKTGRTHQIRVHLAASGHVIAGDDKYGDFDLNRQLQKAGDTGAALKRMFLHAYRLTFIHPHSGEEMTVTAPLPPECARYLESLNTPTGEKATMSP